MIHSLSASGLCVKQGSPVTGFFLFVSPPPPGRTVLIIAHRLSTIQGADQIAVLHHGKLREVSVCQFIILLASCYTLMTIN